MQSVDSVLDAHQIARARALLEPAAPRERVWPALGAAALLALSALAFATAMVMAPPLTREHVAQERGAQ